MPPVCWCVGLLGWAWVGGLALIVLVPVGMLIEEHRARRRGDR